MTWAEENGRAVIRCDGAGCARTVDALEDDWITAATKAVARGWYVPDTIGREASKAARDFCAACRPASTLRSTGIPSAEALAGSVPPPLGPPIL